VSLDAGAVADLLHEIGQRLALRGGNPYRARAYNRAAESLRGLVVPLDEVIASGRLRDIPGIGAGIAAIIPALHETGTHEMLEELRSDIPAGVLEMLQIPGVKPEQVLALFRELGIRSLAELRSQAEAGALARVKRFGAAFEQKVLRGIAALESGRGRRHVHRAAALLDEAETALLRADPAIAEVVIAGDLRRGCELVGDLALVATTSGEPRVLQTGEITVYLTDPARRGITLLLATGSDAHIALLRRHAEQRGCTLTEAGLVAGGKVVGRTERAIYGALGLDFIPPELREGEDEIALALERRLPDLVEARDLRGVLHAHTNLSDGGDTLEAMAEAVQARGYAYFGVSDHSQSAHYAGGLKLDEIEAQHAEVDRLNAAYGGRFRILKGIESDILEDGSLDYPEDVLARFDFVVASVHSRFRLDETRQTERIVRAVANPFTTILGHMTGRQLLRRPGYDVDVEAVLQACAHHGVAVEINANPWRLDLDWRWHRRALELGCMMSINPDAHSVDEIDLVRWGVEMARKGGVPKARVLNCLGLAKLERALARRREATDVRSSAECDWQERR
jgi:DNA polymerase (family X)